MWREPRFPPGISASSSPASCRITWCRARTSSWVPCR